jgi:hypothetical protein
MRISLAGQFVVVLSATTELAPWAVWVALRLAVRRVLEQWFVLSGALLAEAR